MKTKTHRSKVKKVKGKLFYCNFCEMRLAEELVKENHERPQVRVREFAADHYISRLTPDLMGLSSFELLQLLKIIRKERSNMYHHLSVFKRAEKLVQTLLVPKKKQTISFICIWVYFT